MPRNIMSCYDGLIESCIRAHLQQSKLMPVAVRLKMQDWKMHSRI